MLVNHAVAVHHVRLGMRGKGYTGAKRNSKSHSTTAKPLGRFEIGFGTDTEFEEWLAKNRSPTVKSGGKAKAGKTKAATAQAQATKAVKARARKAKAKARAKGMGKAKG